MSMAALRWARSVRGITGSHKCVLLLLADMANDDGECWPSVVGLADDACLSERGARDALRAIEAAGHLERVEGGGRHRTTLYRLRVREPETRQIVPPYRPAETRQQLPETGQQLPETRQLAPKRGQHLPPNPHEPSRTLRNPFEGRRGARLPADWQPGQDEIAFAVRLGLDARRTADNFRDYWHAKAGKDAAKLDWTATWRGWCRRDAERHTRPSATSPRQSNLAWMREGFTDPAPAFDLDLTATEIPQ